MDLEYRYSATANDGRISSQKDWVSGEEVVYQYDSLKRLIRAESVGPEWGQSFTYDGWGNMRAINVVKGSAPVMATTADPATNRLGAWGYDLNGNAASLPGATTLNLTYDAGNRVIHAADGGSVDEWYAYAADNKRVWKRQGTTGVPVVTFWGIDGTRMGEFTVETRTPQGGSLTLALVRYSTPPLTFAGKRIMTEDRLGSVNGSYYPYGQPKSGQTGAGERFATYYKDATGLEYAQNRYYSTTWGRFVAPDPYKASGGAKEPGSWNRYSYVLSDPITFRDPSGLRACTPDDPPPLSFVTIRECPDGTEPQPQQPGPEKPPAPPTDPSPPGNGGGGLPPLISSSANQVLDKAFDNKSCLDALGFIDKQSATKALAGMTIQIGDLGITTVASEADGTVVSFRVAEYRNGRMILNGYGTFLDPINTIAFNVDTQSLSYLNLLALHEAKLGLRPGALTVGAYQALYILHELAHSTGKLADEKGDLGKSWENTREIAKECKIGG